MWYRTSGVDKQEPSYEVKIIEMDAVYAIKRLEFLKQNYNPSEIEVARKKQKVLDHLRSKYGSIANVRLYSKGDSLQEIVAENVYELFGVKRSK
jgi:hypothetical protein